MLVLIFWHRRAKNEELCMVIWLSGCVAEVPVLAFIKLFVNGPGSSKVFVRFMIALFDPCGMCVGGT